MEITRSPNRTAKLDSPAHSPYYGWRLEERRYISRSRFDVHGKQGRKRQIAQARRAERQFKRAQFA